MGLFFSHPNIHGEHDNLGSHGGHLVGEAVGVNTIHTGGEGVAPIGLALALVNDLAIRAVDFDVNVQEATLSYLKGQS